MRETKYEIHYDLGVAHITASNPRYAYIIFMYEHVIGLGNSEPEITLIKDEHGQEWPYPEVNFLNEVYE